MTGCYFQIERQNYVNYCAFADFAFVEISTYIISYLVQTRGNIRNCD